MCNNKFQDNLRIRHIISTRFLLKLPISNKEFSTIEYKKKCADILLSHFIQTVKNVEDKSCEIVVITDSDNLDFVRGIGFPIPITVLTYSELITDIKNRLTEYDYIIHTNCDYDDFFHKDNIISIRNSIRENTTFKMYGFLNGATLVNGEEEPHLFRRDYFGKTGFFSCCTSIIYSTKIKFTDSFPYIIHEVAKKYKGDHTNWKPIIKKEYKNWGIDVLDEDFFDFEKDDKIRFIWIRQDYSYTTQLIKRENKPIHLSDEIVTLNLKNDFGYENK